MDRGGSVQNADVDQRDGAVKARKSNVHRKTILVETANSASRTTGSYLKDKFFRLKSRRAHKRAAMATGRKILQSAHLMISTNSDYRELGDAYLAKRRC
jgi:hypothetical protein